jgi:hypothetical protein
MMVRVTEFPVDTLEEEMYCDHLRDYLTVMFWHPAVDGFLMIVGVLCVCYGHPPTRVALPRAARSQSRCNSDEGDQLGTDSANEFRSQAGAGSLAGLAMQAVVVRHG